MRRGRLRLVLRLLLAAAAAALFALNLLAYRQVWAMTHFAGTGRRTPRPEALSLSEKLGVLVTGARLPRPRNERDPSDVGLAFERHRFPSPDGLALEAWLVPCAEAHGSVLMFHGYADRKASLLSAARAFHELGYAALLLDFRGSGGSEGGTTSIGYHEARDVLAALLHARSIGLPRPHVLFGVSMGAAAVLRAAGPEAARPDALVLQYPFPSLSSAVAHRFRAIGLPVPLAPLVVFWGGVQQGFDGFAHDPLEYARGVRAPTLLMQGDRDDRVSLDEARAIYAALPGPKRFQVFRGAGHESLVEAQPELWRDTVAAFLAALAPRGAPSG